MVLLPQGPARRRRLRRCPTGVAGRRLVGHLLLLRPAPAPPLAGHLERAVSDRGSGPAAAALSLSRLLRRGLRFHVLQTAFRAQPAARRRRDLARFPRLVTPGRLVQFVNADASFSSPAKVPFWRPIALPSEWTLRLLTGVRSIDVSRGF